MQKGYSIRIFVPSGDPSGLRVLNRSNWTGIGLAFSRTGFKEVMQRPELERPGIYVLVGESEDSFLPSVYIGEGDPIINRLKSHNSDKDKDFWTWGVAFTSSDNSLNKALIQHLESRMIEMAQKAKRCNLANGNLPKLPTLIEADLADMEHFLENMLGIFPLVGLSIFETTPHVNKDQKEGLFFIKKGRGGTNATAIQEPEGFIVLKDSKAALTTTPKASPRIKTLRNDLISKGIMIEKEENYIFTQNYLFSSPSLAGAVVLGKTTNGRSKWKNKEGKSLNDLASETVKTKSEQG